MKYDINVVTRLQDNGDGGYTLYAYNNKEELLADHPRIENALSDGATPAELAEIKRKILIEDDPYEDGYLGADEISVEIVDGFARLLEPLRFHAGQ